MPRAFYRDTHLRLMYRSFFAVIFFALFTSASQAADPLYCAEFLQQGAREELVHPTLRSIIYSGASAPARLRALFLFLQSAPTFSDRDIYFLLSQMPRGTDLLLKSAHAELISAMREVNTGEDWVDALDPSAKGQLDLTILYLALRRVKEISRPDLWKLVHRNSIQFAAQSAGWNSYPARYQAAILAAYFSLVDGRI